MGTDKFDEAADGSGIPPVILCLQAAQIQYNDGYENAITFGPLQFDSCPGDKRGIYDSPLRSRVCHETSTFLTNPWSPYMPQTLEAIHVPV